MPTRKIHLVLPGLFDLPLAQIDAKFLAQALPNLNRILRFASARPNQDFSIDSILRTVLAMKHGDERNFHGLPLAQAMAPDRSRDGSRLMLFEAVHLLPDLHNAIIVPIPKTVENLNHVGIIINDLKDLFELDCEIEPVTDGLFLIQLKQFIAPTHYPHLLSVLGKAANPYFEQSRKFLPWYKLLNEMQMFLHQHPINQRRLQQARTTINSLWFWGAGMQPEAAVNELAWYSDDPVLNRFATGMGFSPRSLCEFETDGFDKLSVVIDLSLIESLKTGDDSNIEQVLTDLDQHRMLPISRAINCKRLSLTMHSGFDYDYEVGSFSSYRFWRPARDLLSLKKHLGEI